MFQNRKTSVSERYTPLTRPSDVLTRMTHRAKWRTVSYASASVFVFMVVAALTLYATSAIPEMQIADRTELWKALATLVAVIGAVVFWRLCLRTWHNLYDWRDLRSRRQMVRMSQK